MSISIISIIGFYVALVAVAFAGKLAIDNVSIFMVRIPFLIRKKLKGIFVKTEVLVALITTIGTVLVAVLDKSKAVESGSLVYVMGFISALIIGWIGYKLVFTETGGLIFKSKNSKRRVKLEDHPVFTRISDLQIWVKRDFTMKNKVKKLVFRDILFNALKIYNSRIDKFVRWYQRNEMKEGQELQVGIHHMLNKIIEEITSYYNTNDSQYTEEDKCALVIAVKEFLNWHTKDLSLLFGRITQVCTDDYFYPGIDNKVVIVLAFIESFLTTMFVDVKNTVDGMNGHLKACVYHGLVVGE